MRGLKDQNCPGDRRRQRHRRRDRAAAGRGGLRRRHPRPRCARARRRSRARSRRLAARPALHAVDISDYDAVDARGRGVRGGVRAARVPGQQRRLGPRREFPRHHAGVLEQDRRHQSLRPAQCQPCRAEGHGGARLRPRRQHRLRRRPRRLVGRGGLFGLQGRHDRVRQDDGARAGRARASSSTRSARGRPTPRSCGASSKARTAPRSPKG